MHRLHIATIFSYADITQGVLEYDAHGQEQPLSNQTLLQRHMHAVSAIDYTQSKNGGAAVVASPAPDFSVVKTRCFAPLHLPSQTTTRIPIPCYKLTHVSVHARSRPCISVLFTASCTRSLRLALTEMQHFCDVLSVAQKTSYLLTKSVEPTVLESPLTSSPCLPIVLQLVFSILLQLLLQRYSSPLVQGIHYTPPTYSSPLP